MGLSGPRNRRKLDYDPNNTKWTRDETTFGQKILRAQGWEPGKFLGAQHTSHAQLHSAASLAPIKINLKDDTLGLGAKIRQKQSDECTGLDAFKDLLGRLNGKSEETLDKERQVRSEIKTNLFVERKYGPMRFVSGGLLVGDQIKMAELVDNKSEITFIKDEPISESSDVEVIKKEKREKKEKKEKKSKKRKASDSEETDPSDSKREKKRKKRSKADEEPENNDTVVEKSTKKKDKKEKKSKRSGKAVEDENDVELVESTVKPKRSKKSKDTSEQESLANSSTETSGDAISEKAEKKDKKREKKRKEAESREASVVMTTTTSSTTTLATTPQGSGSSTPSNTGTSTPQALSARHRSRARHIAAKKMAFSDMQALNQIFMIKSV
ncbi:hypothetical protein GGR51DRAFT_153981 [Nemania sp. FL0031]|nr:hypothetical protein GGR51DRAFT_153981 [Nemania sp. FL0031]